MKKSKSSASAGNEAFSRVLGYLNFSSGSPEPQFLAALIQLFKTVPTTPQQSTRSEAALGATVVPSPDRTETWRRVLAGLRSELERLSQTNEAFADVRQASAVIQALEQHLIPQYLEFHRDLLFHLDSEAIFNSLMVGRACEALLRQSPPWDDPAAAAQQAIRELNDFVGYRPIPTLETRRIEPHPHERVRPIPLYVHGAGVAEGPYHELISQAIEILKSTDDDLRRAAWFDLDKLEEISLDPRAYDFDHPVNKRPNYHFGEWDPHRIDGQGDYRRFVVREVTLRALLARVEEPSRPKISRKELEREAATVLGGTILMASAISGDGPTTHDSNTSLVNLIPRIATFRDAYYEREMAKLPAKHAERMAKEVERLHQPFAGARHHLNMHLARQRASQLEHVRLAKVFARMGYLDAAERQVDTIAVASARLLTRIDCGLTAGYHALAKLDRAEALRQVKLVWETLRRGIACGAIVDPWNILGFDAQFSLFPTLENSVHDHRIDELLRIIDRCFDLLARLWSDAAAANDISMSSTGETLYQDSARWWNQFAAHEVSSVESASPMAGWEAARDVSRALRQWHEAGAQKGDVSFWAPHVESFSSPKAYALVIETLLARQDDHSAMSLLVHWVGRSDTIPLEEGDSSFARLATAWVRRVAGSICPGEPPALSEDSSRRASLLRKFFDFLEANAEHVWEVPEYELRSRAAAPPTAHPREDEPPHEEGDEETAGPNLFRAAYEDVVYRDSTNDGVEGSIFDTDEHAQEAAQGEAERIVTRLQFLRTLATCWLHTAAPLVRLGMLDRSAFDGLKLDASLRGWLDHARKCRRQAMALMQEVAAERLPRNGLDVSAMMQYDQLRVIKDALLEQVLAACVEMTEAELYLSASLISLDPDTAQAAVAAELSVAPELAGLDQELAEAAGILAAAMAHDQETTEARAAPLMERLTELPILYTPLARGGNPAGIIDARVRRRYIHHLLIAFPRLGLLRRGIDLLDKLREMEQNVPSGESAITEFDESFDVAMRELVLALVRGTTREAPAPTSVKNPGVAPPPEEDDDADTLLVTCLEHLAERILASWLDHSRTLRLSVLERVREPKAWDALVAFIQTYGHDLFTQDFLYFSNIRAILHCGTEAWISELRRESTQQAPFKLIADLDVGIRMDQAADQLGLILEAVAENYDEYRDYNSTTTQSDCGEMLYSLLDFLRLRSEYDRVAWNLRPVVIAHRVLVQQRRNEAAQVWRRLLHDRLGEEATRYHRKLTKLQQKYAMQMGSVAQRIGQRFLQPMTIDRMRALVRLAIEQVRVEGPRHAFEILEEEAQLLMRDPLGWGVAIPDWLEALEEEVSLLDPTQDLFASDEATVPLTAVRLTHEQLQAELRRIME